MKMLNCQMFLNATHDLCWSWVPGLAGSFKRISNFLFASIPVSSTDYYFPFWDVFAIFSFRYDSLWSGPKVYLWVLIF